LALAPWREAIKQAWGPELRAGGPCLGAGKAERNGLKGFIPESESIFNYPCLYSLIEGMRVF